MKRLVVCCDGTWMNADMGVKDANADESPMDVVLQPPSNVTRICRSVASTDKHGNSQIAYYQSGVGTENLWDSLMGGLAGAGLGEHIREAYHFIAQNYDQEAGDEIILVGFSRGSFTARSIAAFISAVGLLTPKGMVSFYPIFQDWENMLKPLKDWKPNPKFPWEGKRPNLFSNKDEYTKQLFERGLTRRNVKVKAVACYDTVGSLGIPAVGIFKSGVPPNISLDFAFVDTSVPENVEHAIHALALDELRKPFSPTMWELPEPKDDQTLKQCWFQGAHADVGGGYDDVRPSDIPLAWMVSQLSEYMTFDSSVLKLQLHIPGSAEYKDNRFWSCGKIHTEYKGIFRATEYFHRVPMEYHRYDHNTGKVTDVKLKNTHESIHSSVRIRMGIPGKGLEDQGDYNPASLETWDVTGLVPPSSSGQAQLSLEQVLEGQKKIVWRKGDLVLPEEPLSPLEYELLTQYAPRLEANFLSIAPKEHRVTSAFRNVTGSVSKLFS